MNAVDTLTSDFYHPKINVFFKPLSLWYFLGQPYYINIDLQDPEVTSQGEILHSLNDITHVLDYGSLATGENRA